MRIGVIGGTGVDEVECFVAGKVEDVMTPYGGADVVRANFGGRDVFFVPRHGLAHSVPPSHINYRAQIAALKKLGVDTVLGVCAVGSLRTDLPPGSFAVLSDFIDLTKQRAGTFFDCAEGPVVHTDLTHPYCPVVSTALVEACEAAGAAPERGAVYVGVEGPRYETPAEIRLYASWGGDVVGMTNTPEVILAREAGLCYGALAIVTNLACGLCPTPLAHDEVRAAMASAADKLQAILHHAMANVPEQRSCTCPSNDRLII